MRYFKLKCKQKHLYFAFKCYTSIFAHKRELFCQGNAFNAVRRLFLFTEFIKNTHLRRSFSRSIIQELKSSAKLRQSIYLKMVHSKLFLVHWMNYTKYIIWIVLYFTYDLYYLSFCVVWKLSSLILKSYDSWNIFMPHLYLPIFSNHVDDLVHMREEDVGNNCKGA